MQLGISRAVVAESQTFRRSNRLDLMPRHGSEVIDLDLEEARLLLGEFIESNPETGTVT